MTAWCAEEEKRLSLNNDERASEEMWNNRPSWSVMPMRPKRIELNKKWHKHLRFTCLCGQILFHNGILRETHYSHETINSLSGEKYEKSGWTLQIKFGIGYSLLNSEDLLERRDISILLNYLLHSLIIEALDTHKSSRRRWLSEMDKGEQFTEHNAIATTTQRTNSILSKDFQKTHSSNIFAADISTLTISETMWEGVDW